MGKKSVKENKNIYQISREKAELTREAASNGMDGLVTVDRIEKIEYGKTDPYPDEIVAMSKCYKDFGLCNHYCTNVCEIGHAYVPQINLNEDLTRITLQLLNSLNTVNKEKDRLIEIAADGEITPDELKDFANIRKLLKQMSISIETLKYWTETMIAEGKIDEKALAALED